MSEARRKAPPRAMAAVLRRPRAIDATDAVPMAPINATDAQPMLPMPAQPSAEYVARANQLMGREPAPMNWDDEREHGGMYGTQPLAKKAAGRLPINPYPKAPQGPPVGAEQVARAKAAGASPEEVVAIGSFAGARASGSAGAPKVDPRMLAQMLRAGR
jgi:hypothetical protein